MDENYIKDLFDKKIICPVCNSTFHQKVVKVKSPRIISKDSDFFIRYKAINPYFYDVWICNSCGYSSLKSEFFKLRDFQKNKILENISPKWSKKNYPAILNVDNAIERYKLALITSNIINKRATISAIITLKLAWMYRLKKDSNLETFFLEKSLACFLDAFYNDPFPIFGLQRDGLTYLIGDLYKRLNDNKNAILWFSQVITSINASPKIKEMARTAKYNLKNLEIKNV